VQAVLAPLLHFQAFLLRMLVVVAGVIKELLDFKALVVLVAAVLVLHLLPLELLELKIQVVEVVVEVLVALPILAAVQAAPVLLSSN
jgi:hypothetical protein